MGKKIRIKIICPHCKEEIDVKEFNYFLVKLEKLIE